MVGLIVGSIERAEARHGGQVAPIRGDRPVLPSARTQVYQSLPRVSRTHYQADVLLVLTRQPQIVVIVVLDHPQCILLRELATVNHHQLAQSAHIEQLHLIIVAKGQDRPQLVWFAKLTGLLMFAQILLHHPSTQLLPRARHHIMNHQRQRALVLVPLSVHQGLVEKVTLVEEQDMGQRPSALTNDKRLSEAQEPFILILSAALVGKKPGVWNLRVGRQGQHIFLWKCLLYRPQDQMDLWGCGTSSLAECRWVMTVIGLTKTMTPLHSLVVLDRLGCLPHHRSQIT